MSNFTIVIIASVARIRKGGRIERGGPFGILGVPEEQG